MKRYHLKQAIVMSILLVVAFTTSTILQSSKVITTIEITGEVIDGDSGNALAGVTVTSLSDKTTTKTDSKGKYSIKVSESAKTLRFQLKKYNTENKLIAGKTKIDVVLWSAIELVEDAEEEIAVSYLNSTNAKKTKGRRSNQAFRPIMSGNPVSYDQPIIEHNTEEYDVINENKFKDVKSNPLSTFSVDVDRASYANTRRFLNNNQLPQKDVIRIEELINYFEYDYPQPKGKEPFSTNLEMGTCPWNSKHYLVNIGIQGKNIPVENLPASNLVFLLDVSGSMSDANKLPLLQKAFKILVENLRPEDKVSMVVYAGAAGVVLPSTSGKDKDKMIAALDKLSAGGSTAGGEGIQLAYKIAKENFIEGGNNRVILATDGDFNIGQSSDAALVRLIEDKRKDNIFLTILGFGMGNYKDSKMEQLSNAGNGNYAYIDNVLEAKKTLGKEIWGTLYTIAKDVKIQIEFNPAKVKAYRLIGYENRMLAAEDFNDDKKDAGEIGAGHTVTAIYEIIPADSDEIISNIDDLEYQDTKIKKSDNLMTLKLRYKEPEGTESKLIVSKVKGDNIKTRGFSENFTFSASVAQFGMLLRDSDFKGSSTFKNTMELAKSSKGKDEEGYRAEFIKLIEIAELLSK